MDEIWVIVNQVARPYGSSRVALTLARELSVHAQVTIMTYDGTPGSNQRNVPQGVAHRHLHRSKGVGSNAWLVAKLVRTMWSRRRSPSVALLSFLSVTNFAVVIAAKLVGWRGSIVVTEHSIQSRALLTYGRKGRALKLAMRWIYRPPVRVVAVSRAIADDLVTSLGVAPELVRVVYNPVDMATPTGALTKECASVRGEAISSDDFVCVAELKWVKRQEVLIRALRYVQSPGQLVLIGDGGDFKALKRLSEGLGVAHRVRFLGRLEEPWLTARRARASLLTPYYEGFGLAAVESAANGVIPIGVAVGGLSEVLDVVGGIAIPDADDSEELARNVAKALDGTYGRPWTVRSDRMSQFSPATVAIGYLAVME